MFPQPASQTPFIKTTKFRCGLVSSWLTKPCIWVSFLALLTFYFSSGFLVFQCQASLRYKHSAQGRRLFQRRTADRVLRSPQIPQLELLCIPSAGLDLTTCSPRTWPLNAVPRRAARSLPEQHPLTPESSTVLPSSRFPGKTLQYNRFGRAEPLLPSLHVEERQNAGTCRGSSFGSLIPT